MTQPIYGPYEETKPKEVRAFTDSRGNLYETDIEASLSNAAYEIVKMLQGSPYRHVKAVDFLDAIFHIQKHFPGLLKAYIELLERDLE